MGVKIPFFVVILLAFPNVILVALYLVERGSLPKSTANEIAVSPDENMTQHVVSIERNSTAKYRGYLPRSTANGIVVYTDGNTTPHVVVIEINSTVKYNKVQKMHRHLSPRKKKPERYIRRLPQAFLLGCMKSGTYTLKSFLREHPSIVTHIKPELYYYHKNMTEQMEKSHLNQMPYSRPNQITFESTTGYFRSSLALKQLNTKYPAMKYFVVVRDPINRMVSHYSQLKGNNRLNLATVKEKLQRVLIRENGSLDASHGFIQASIYSESLAMWLKVIPRERFHIVDGDAFAKNPVPELQRMEKFFEVRPYFRQDMFIYSKSKKFYCFKKNGIPFCMNSSKGKKRPELDPAVVDKLCDFFRPYNKAFISLAGQQFDWRKCYV